MKWVFSALVVLWSLRAIEGPASADLRSIDVFTKITPRKVAKWRLSNPIAVGPKQPRRCCYLVSLTFASWNQIAGWLRLLDGLRAAA